MVWLRERDAVVDSLLCSMAATLLTDDLFSHDPKKKHAAVIFSFQCSFGEHTCIYTADHIENVLFFHLNLEITKMVCRLKVLVTFNTFKAPLSSLVYVALADKAFSSNTY